jgi:alkyl sulfatase BDS1-like metallo-beta-lactamase superfamily hydrolase
VNHLVVDAPDGLIVFDTGWNDGAGAGAHELIRTVSNRPIAAIVYTHSHFCFGGKGMLGGQDPSSVRVHAHLRCHANAQRILSHEDAGLHFLRLAQAGSVLPQQGPNADPVGLSAGIVGGRTWLPITDTWEKDGATGTIAGEPVIVHTLYPFDADDQLIVRFPRLDLIAHGHMSGNLPSVASNAGGRFRDPVPWLAGLDLVMSLAPEHLVGTHGPFYSGRACVQRVMEYQRDALQFLYDQSVRGLNRGLSAQEVLDDLRMPPELANEPSLSENYSQWDFHIKAIYSGLCNWYWGEATELLPIPARFESERMVAGFGGSERLRETIRQALTEGHYAWAARLARHLVRVYPDDLQARTLLVQALREMGQRAHTSTTRAICLTQAQEWEGGPSRRDVALGIDPDLARLSPPGTWIRALGFRFRPKDAPNCTLSITFPELSFTAGLHLRRGVAVYQQSVSPNPEFSITLSQHTWMEIFLDRLSWRQALADGRATSPQPSEAWENLWSHFDPWPPYRTQRG